MHMRDVARSNGQKVYIDSKGYDTLEYGKPVDDESTERSSKNSK